MPCCKTCQFSNIDKLQGYRLGLGIMYGLVVISIEETENPKVQENSQRKEVTIGPGYSLLIKEVKIFF